MFKFLSLLLIALFAFDASLVAARPQSLQSQRSRFPDTVDIRHLTTNTKRFAAGFPPLPPKHKPTKVSSAKRGVTSPCSKSGTISVFSTDGVSQGYLSKVLMGNQRYTLVTNIADAGIFSSTVSSSGDSQQINILAPDGVHYLAGLIPQNQALGDGINTAATLGNALATNPNDPPQTNKDPSITNDAAETAIWMFTRSSNTLTATWVNNAGQNPQNPTVYLRYVKEGGRILLSNSATSQTGVLVSFQWNSVNDGCGN